MSGMPKRPRRSAAALSTVLVGLAFSAVAGTSAQESSTASPQPPAAPAGSGSWGEIGSGGSGFRVTPTRVVFDEHLRSAELTLVNTGSEPATYRVSLVRMRMSETGGIEEVSDALPGEAFADSLVRFSPRQVDLDPGAAQTVRLQLRQPANLPAGEYRSHLVFRALPPTPSAENDESGRSVGTRGVRIALRPVFGAAIPVIVRHGETAASVTLGDLELLRPTRSDGAPRLMLVMRRAGNRSVYGDLTITHTEPGGLPRVVGSVKGLAVYTPNPVRRVEVPLRHDPGDFWRGGTLHVTYEEVAEEPELLAEAELALP